MMKWQWSFRYMAENSGVDQSTGTWANNIVEFINTASSFGSKFKIQNAENKIKQTAASWASVYIQKRK